MQTLIGYKLFRLRRDGTLGPLFINARQRIPVGKCLKAEDHPTKGFAHRPGWHITAAMHAPHLSMKGRVWARVVFSEFREYRRPAHQGGLWYTANKMKVLEVLQ